MAAEELRISREDAQKVDETVLGRFLSAYAASSPEYRVFVTSDESGKPLTDRVFEQQSAIIRKLAEGGAGDFCRQMRGLYSRGPTATALIHLSMRY